MSYELLKAYDAAKLGLDEKSRQDKNYLYRAEVNLGCPAVSLDCALKKTSHMECTSCGELINTTSKSCGRCGYEY